MPLHLTVHFTESGPLWLKWTDSVYFS